MHLDETFPTRSIVAPFWTDLDPSSGGCGNIWAGDTDLGFMVVFDKVCLAGSTTDLVTVEVLLAHGGAVQMEYIVVQGTFTNTSIGFHSACKDMAFTLCYDECSSFEGWTVSLATPSNEVGKTPLNETFGYNISGGGGATLSQGSQLFLSEHAVVSDNVAAYGDGGGVQVNGPQSYLEISGRARVLHNVAVRGHGGGVHATDNATVGLFQAALLEKNFAMASDARGGGIGLDRGSHLGLQNESAVRNNTCRGFGGGIAGSYSSTVLLTDDSSLQGNQARVAGGGMHLQHGASSVFQARAFVKACASSGQGGGIVLLSAALTLSDTTSVRRCTAVVGGGGVIAKAGSRVMLDNNASVRECSCRSGDGGGILAEENSVIMLTDRAAISQCEASIGSGGGVAITSGSRLSIVGLGALITQSSALLHGGGVFVNSTGSALVRGTVSIANNVAKQGDGGGACVRYRFSVRSNVTSVSFPSRSRRFFRYEYEIFIYG